METVKASVCFLRCISIVLLVMVIWYVPPLAVAQSAVSGSVKRDTPSRPIHQNQTVHIDVDLVLVDVTVTDRHDRLVIGLASDNFRIFENNVEQEIQYFSSEDVPFPSVLFSISVAAWPTRPEAGGAWPTKKSPLARADSVFANVLWQVRP